MARTGEAGSIADIRARLATARNTGNYDGWISPETTSNYVADFAAGKRESLGVADAARAGRAGVSQGAPLRGAERPGAEPVRRPGEGTGRPLGTTLFQAAPDPQLDTDGRVDASAQPALQEDEGKPNRASHLDRAPMEVVNGQLRLSSRVPSDVNAQAAEGTLATNVEATKHPKAAPYRHKSAVIYRASNRTQLDPEATDDQVLEAVVKTFQGNLKWLWDEAFTPEIRDRARQWYVGARRIAEEFADEFNVTVTQVVGVIAGLSPQNDWNQNVALARRLLMPMWDANAVPGQELYGGTSNPVFDGKLWSQTTGQSTSAHSSSEGM